MWRILCRTETTRLYVFSHFFRFHSWKNINDMCRAGVHLAPKNWGLCICFLSSCISVLQDFPSRRSCKSLRSLLGVFLSATVSHWAAVTPVLLKCSRPSVIVVFTALQASQCTVFQAEDRCCPSGFWSPPDRAGVCCSEPSCLSGVSVSSSVICSEFYTTGTLRKSKPAAPAPCSASAGGVQTGSPGWCIQETLSSSLKWLLLAAL